MCSKILKNVENDRNLRGLSLLTSCTSLQILLLSVDLGRAPDRAPTQLTCRGVALCPPCGYRSNSISALVQDVSLRINDRAAFLSYELVQSSDRSQLTVRSFWLSQGVALLSINHSGRSNAATISFNLAPGASLGTANESIDPMVKR